LKKKKIKNKKNEKMQKISQKRQEIMILN